VLLDTAQVMPIFVYFSPVQIFFGLQFAPAVVVTVIYALPPAVRLTNLGLRQVPVVTRSGSRSGPPAGSSCSRCNCRSPGAPSC